MANFKRLFKKFLGFEEENEEIEDEMYESDESIKPDEEIRLEKLELTMHPKTFADACDIIEQLELGNTVIVNMSELDVDTSKRISDFILGAVFVLKGDVEKISKRVFRFWTNR